MSTTASILDDFLIDTTRLSLIRRYKPPFELDRLVLSAEKKQIMLALMKQQKEADKDLGPPPVSSSSGDQMDVDVTPVASAAVQPSTEDSKMDVDEPNTLVKDETMDTSPSTPPNAEAQRAQEEENEKKQKLIRLAELDKKVKEAEAKISELEDAKGELFVKLKQVLAVESKSRQEEQRIMQQRAEEARQAALIQQQQLQLQQMQQPIPNPFLPVNLSAYPELSASHQPVAAPVLPTSAPLAAAAPLPTPAPSTPAAPTGFPSTTTYTSDSARSRSPDRSFTSPRGGGNYSRDYSRRDDDLPAKDRNNDRYGNDRSNDYNRDRDRDRPRDRFDDRDNSRDNRDRYSAAYPKDNNRPGSTYSDNRDRWDNRDSSRDTTRSFPGPRRDFRDTRDYDRDRDRDRDRDVNRDRVDNRDRDRNEPVRDRDNRDGWNRRYSDRDAYTSRPLTSPPPSSNAASYPSPSPSYSQASYSYDQSSSYQSAPPAHTGSASYQPNQQYGQQDYSNPAYR